jgi:hypothetical protein
MDQIHLSPLVDQIQLAPGHISNTTHLVVLSPPHSQAADMAPLPGDRRRWRSNQKNGGIFFLKNIDLRHIK